MLENQLIKPTLHALEYIQYRCAKYPTCFSTPWLPSSGSFTAVKVMLLEMVDCMQHSHMIAQIFKFQLKQRQNHPQKF